MVPTLADFCGIRPPEGVKLGGRSVRPLLSGEAAPEDGSWPDRTLVTDSQWLKDPIKWRNSSIMTSRWRLVNGEELYDIKADPAQQQDVAPSHPQVVERLRDFYDSWWAELEPTFDLDAGTYLGHEADNPTTLTSHDWITTGFPPGTNPKSAMPGPAPTAPATGTSMWPKKGTGFSRDHNVQPGR